MRRDQERISDRMRRDARIAGLRDFQTPSLEAVERRRRQLWLRTTAGLVVIAGVVVVLSALPAHQSLEVEAGSLRTAVLIIAAAFFAFAADREMRLSRLTRSLTNERVLTAALTNRLHEVSLLLDADKAMNSVLDLTELLDTILRSACELLEAGGGSVMLVEGTDLVAVSVRGRDEAEGTRVRLGEGVAGQVALRREPILIDGHVHPDDFPGLAPREPYVDSAMSVPLVHRAELQGVLNVNAPLGRAFTEYDLRALAVFAEQASMAIANSRLYETERAHAAELRQIRRDREVG